MDDLAISAQLNGGYIMRHQLLDIGYSDKSIRAAVRDNDLVRLRHGTYAPASTHAAWSVEERHRVMTYSVLDKLGPNVAATHISASAIHRFDLYDVDLSSIHVTRLDGHHGRKEAGVIYHSGGIDHQDDLVELDGRLVTEHKRAVMESCTLMSIESGMVLACSALKPKRITKEELVDYSNSRLDHWLGSRKARIAIQIADGGCETVGEARSMHMFFRNGLPRPETQATILNSVGIAIARTDFTWHGYRHIGEFDGLVKYGRLNPNSRDLGQVIVAEKKREDLVRDQNFGMSRWLWTGLAPSAQARTAADIRRGMDRSKRLYLRNATHIPMG